MIIDYFKAIFLGIIEGLTEFIPVSSTAHLLVVSHLINFSSIKNNVFEIVIQLGAILAVCFVYHQRIAKLIFEIKQKEQREFIIKIILAFLPAAIIGSIFHNHIKEIFFSNFVIALALIIGGLVMIIFDRKPNIENGSKTISFKIALLIGFFQCLAMIPGVSRSGATIIGGILLGLNRVVAVEFSFFLALPTIFAASLLDFISNYQDLEIHDLEIILLGTISSFISSVLVIKWFLNFISKNNFMWFGIYRIIIGSLILLIL